MTNSSKAAPRKTVHTAGGEASKRTLANELSDVLGVVLRHASLFPRSAEHTRISLSLESGDRLELEFTGQGERAPTREEQGHVCLGHDFKTAELRAFYSIDELDLGESAKAAAQNLQQQFPNDVKFTSGRRSIAQQAAAMAPNIVKNRKWVQLTYKDTPQRAALQKWVDENPSATTAAKISAGLEGVMNSWSEAQQRNFSRHITGDAFDIQPVEGVQGDKIKQAIPKLQNLHWHTFNEGGLEIWHAQFKVAGDA